MKPETTLLNPLDEPVIKGRYGTITVDHDSDGNPVVQASHKKSRQLRKIGAKKKEDGRWLVTGGPSNNELRAIVAEELRPWYNKLSFFILASMPSLLLAFLASWVFIAITWPAITDMFSQTVEIVPSESMNGFLITGGFILVATTIHAACYRRWFNTLTPYFVVPYIRKTMSANLQEELATHSWTL